MTTWLPGACNVAHAEQTMPNNRMQGEATEMTTVRRMINAFRALATAVLLAAVGPTAMGQVKVAAVLPLSGPLAAAGQDIERTLRAWADQHNRQRVQPAVELLLLDDRSSPDGARAATQQALGAGARLFTSCFGSVSCMAIAQQLRGTDVPLIGAIAGDERLRSADLPNVFTTRSGARGEVGEILRYLSGIDLTRIYLVVQDDAFGQSYRRAFDELSQSRPQFKPLGVLTVDPKQPAYERVAAAAMAEPSHAIVLLANTTHSLGVIRAASQAGYHGWYFNLAAQANPLFLGEIGKLTSEHKLLATFVTTTPSPMADSSAPYRAVATKAGASAATYLGLEAFANATLVAAVLQVEPRPTPDSLGKLLPTFNGTRLAGLKVSYDPARRQVAQWLELAVVSRQGVVKAR